MTNVEQEIERVIIMSEIPTMLEDYLNYMETIKGTSPNTVKEYFFDLRMFLRF